MRKNAEKIDVNFRRTGTLKLGNNFLKFYNSKMKRDILSLLIDSLQSLVSKIKQFLTGFRTVIFSYLLIDFLHHETL